MQRKNQLPVTQFNIGTTYYLDTEAQKNIPVVFKGCNKRYNIFKSKKEYYILDKTGKSLLNVDSNGNVLSSELCFLYSDHIAISHIDNNIFAIKLLEQIELDNIKFKIDSDIIRIAVISKDINKYTIPEFNSNIKIKICWFYNLEEFISANGSPDKKLYNSIMVDMYSLKVRSNYRICMRYTETPILYGKIDFKESNEELIQILSKYDTV